MTKDALVSAGICIAVGCGVAVIAAVRPEGLKAPAWVVYSAAGAFGLTGLVIVAAGLQARRARRVLIVALLAAMFTPPDWVGDRACTVGGDLSGMTASGLMRRVPVGLGLLAVMLLTAWRYKPAKNGE